MRSCGTGEAFGDDFFRLRILVCAARAAQWPFNRSPHRCRTRPSKLQKANLPFRKDCRFLLCLGSSTTPKDPRRLIPVRKCALGDCHPIRISFATCRAELSAVCSSMRSEMHSRRKSMIPSISFKTSSVCFLMRSEVRSCELSVISSRMSFPTCPTRG